MNTFYHNTRHKQKGAMTLLVVVLILIAMTIGSFGMVSTTRLETSMTLNDQRNREAFQSAQSGIDFFLGHMGSNTINQTALCNPDNWVVNIGNTTEDFLLNFTGPNGGAFDFDPDVQSEECLGLPFEIITRANIWSRGFSADGEAVRTLSSEIDLTTAWNYSTQAAKEPFVDDPTGAPLVSRRGNVSVGGNSDIGFCATADCKSLVTSDSSNSPLVDRDANLITHDVNGVLSISRTEGEGRFADSTFTGSEDVASLSPDEFFATYVGNGVTKSEFISSTNTQTINGIGAGASGSSEIDKSRNQIFVNGDIKLTGGKQEIGSQENPVIMVVTGDVEISGNATIWGTLYVVDGNVSGTFRLMGRLVSENGINLTGNNAIYTDSANRVVPNDSDFDPDDSLASSDGNRSAFVRIGSWREIQN